MAHCMELCNDVDGEGVRGVGVQARGSRAQGDAMGMVELYAMTQPAPRGSLTDTIRSRTGAARERQAS